MKPAIIIFIQLIMIMGGCDQNEQLLDAIPDGGANGQIKTNSDVIRLENGKSPDDFLIDQYEILESGINDNLLYIKLRYGGGCENHEFGLAAYNYFLESIPIQANLLLYHDSGGDACKALVYEEFHFDLSPLINEYSNTYPQISYPLKLNLLIDKETGETIDLIISE